jgi:hypothetical protein
MTQTYRDYRTRGLSASSQGRGIPVSATTSPGTLIHQALSSVAANEWDVLWLRAVNTSTSTVKLTVEWGGTSSTDHIEVTIPPASGFTEVVAGHGLQGGAQVRAFAATADVLVLHGIVRRYEYRQP